MSRAHQMTLQHRHWTIAPTLEQQFQIDTAQRRSMTSKENLHLHNSEHSKKSFIDKYLKFVLMTLLFPPKDEGLE